MGLVGGCTYLVLHKQLCGNEPFTPRRHPKLAAQKVGLLHSATASWHVRERGHSRQSIQGCFICAHVQAGRCNARQRQGSRRRGGARWRRAAGPCTGSCMPRRSQIIVWGLGRDESKYPGGDRDKFDGSMLWVAAARSGVVEVEARWVAEGGGSTRGDARHLGTGWWMASGMPAAKKGASTSGMGLWLACSESRHRL